MEERVQKGLWPHPPLEYTDVLKHLSSLIQSQEWFPRDIAIPREGIFIQNVNGKFICHCLAYGPFGNRRENEDKSYEFNNAKDAADYYLRNDLHIPGDLDGWVVK